MVGHGCRIFAVSTRTTPANKEQRERNRVCLYVCANGDPPTGMTDLYWGKKCDCWPSASLTPTHRRARSSGSTEVLEGEEVVWARRQTEGRGKNERGRELRWSEGMESSRVRGSGRVGTGEIWGRERERKAEQGRDEKPPADIHHAEGGTQQGWLVGSGAEVACGPGSGHRTGNGRLEKGIFGCGEGERGSQNAMTKKEEEEEGKKERKCRKGSRGSS
ncbi:hypothetical protein An11g08540 [Aspergillus niger]|uniref:Uncharacterized protein n=2 Tax=Aspergillus niger TaxID=5061 RepID=A2QXD6_ASPNC|nr:hypothetical protein An11g08540 [Aspergillus niger]CAK46044.1 hypothetical protein An11g08540 [Aspergillus niger]